MAGFSIVDGILTWGVPTSVITPDPAWVPPPVPTLTGGTIGRAVTRSRVSSWLLDLHLGDRAMRFGTRAASVSSRVAAARVLYVPSLDALSWEVGQDSASLRVMASTPSDWALARKRYNSLRGWRAVLRLWFDDQELENAYVALQGLVTSATYGDPEDPFALQLDIDRNPPELSREMLSPTARLDKTTFSGLLGDIPEGGFYYPLVIGHPGSPRGPGGLPSPATPALPLNYTLTRRMLIAGHRVEASRVWLFNLTEGEVKDLPVSHGVDDLGQEFAYIDLLGVPIFTFDSEHEYAVGWDRQWGGGLMHRGRVVAGLGDLLEWGSDTYSLVQHDAGEMSARRTALNRFRVDTVINEQIKWTEWLESNVLSLFEIEEVQGQHGAYYEEIRHKAHQRHVVGKLNTDIGGSGYRVHRISGIREDDEEIINVFTFAYLPFAASHTEYVEVVTVNPPRGTALVATIETLVSPLCRLSEQLFGRREGTWETGISSDPATLRAIALSKAERHAIPKLIVSYKGGLDLLSLRKNDVVELYDTRNGAAFEGDLAIVRGLQITPDQSVIVTLAVQTPSE